MSNRLESRQVAWFEAHEFKERIAGHVGERPVAGTPSWCALPDDDVRKVAALFDAGVLWCLATDTEQEQLASASRDIADATDWPKVASEMRSRAAFYAERPWLKRRCSDD